VEQKLNSSIEIYEGKEMKERSIVHLDEEDKKMVILQWYNQVVDIANLRTSEKEVALLEAEDESSEIYMAIYDLRSIVRLQAVLGIFTTILVCGVLGSGAMFFSKLTTDLVISPIEDMVQRVNDITNDPLAAAHAEEERMLFEELEA